MASIDWTVLGLGALVGIGCRKQLKACGRVAASTAASLAGVAAATAKQVADEASEKKSAEAEAAEQRLAEVDLKINQLLQEWQGKGNGQG